MSQHVLIVEDEPKIAKLLAEYLEADGFAASTLDDGAEVVEWVRQYAPDFITLDLMLPNRSGIDICRDLRQFSDVPIVMITAKVDEIDRLLGLGIGADDYICKPFSPREVVARIKAIQRRLARQGEAGADQGGFNVDPERFTASYAGADLDLTPVEFRLLQALIERPGKVYSREQLMNRAYPDRRVVGDRTMDSHVKNMRKKIRQAAPDADPIQSVYGVGYKID